MDDLKPNEGAGDVDIDDSVSDVSFLQNMDPYQCDSAQIIDKKLRLGEGQSIELDLVPGTTYVTDEKGVIAIITFADLRTHR